MLVTKDFNELVNYLAAEGFIGDGLNEEAHAQFAKPEGNRIAAYQNAKKYADQTGNDYIYGYTSAGGNTTPGKFFALDQLIKWTDTAEKEFRAKYKNCATVYVAYSDKKNVKECVDSVEEDYTGNPEERTTHLDYTDDVPADDKFPMPKNITKKNDTECKINKGILHDEDDMTDEEFLEAFGKALAEKKNASK